MELSPNDIRNVEFPTQMRGYDKEAVDNFMEQAATVLESHKQENLKLSMEIESVKIQLAGLKQFEDAIKNAAIDARRNADMTMSNARKEAENLMAKAHAEATQILASRVHKKDELDHQIEKLETIRGSYYSKLRGLISSHLEWIEGISHADASQPQLSADRLEITDSSEVEGSQRETIATEPSHSEPIRTEEANAAGQIVQAQPPQDLANALKSVIRDNSQPATPPVVDDELAAALANYRKSAIEGGHAPQTHRQQDPSDLTDRVKLTSSRQTHRSDTETGGVPFDVSASEPTTPNAASTTNNLTQVLDNVVHKFEEEMDKAAKS